MADVRQVVAVFRDRAQATLAVTEARRQGFDVSPPDALVEDAAGLHVILRITGAPEPARQLLLDYGAYSASIS
jgi:hypothetical protein